MLIEVALNGNRSRKEADAVPQSPAELAAAAKEAVAAGACAVHFHVYESAARESRRRGSGQGDGGRSRRYSGDTLRNQHRRLDCP